MTLTDIEKQLAHEVDFDEDICLLVKEQTKGFLRHLMRVMEQGDEGPAEGLSVAVEREQVEPLIAELQPKLSPRGYRAF